MPNKKEWIKSDNSFREFIQSKKDGGVMKELTVKQLIEKLSEFEPDSVVLLCSWDQENKYGYNYSTIEEVVDETGSFPNLNSQVKILTKDGAIVSHLKLRGSGQRFVVLQ